MIVNRAYAGAADLRRMQASVADAYAITSLRVGDLAWLTRYHSHRDLSLHIRLWEDDSGQVVGWTYLRTFGGFNVFVAPGHADETLLDEMLAEVVDAAAAAVATGDPPVSLYTYGLDLARSTEDRALAAALERHGFRRAPTTEGVMTRSLDEVPEPVLPAGYRLGWVETREQGIGRVEAQRAAFAPSDFLLERYERIRRTWPYRAELDRIVLTEDATVVAFCTAWLDERNGAGLLEPVGTHPDHQRRGLASAVCLDALRALRAAGARVAQVGFGSEAGRATYSSIGFALNATDLVYRRDPS
ncbi:MAG: GNAT family N-acetyltransferase [Chloroflexota bacterium]